MSASAWAPLWAQVSAEIQMRLRSAATPIALVALCAATFFWIPDPSSNAASLTWEIDGRIHAPVYSMAYVGLSVAILSCMLLPLGGFYLVVGSVRRDRERGVGAILAATPLSKAGYLGGKFAAHFAYLLVLDLLALLTGFVAFLRYGTGPFTPLAFAGPYLVLTVPVIVVVASSAVFFDATPGLRGRGGLVIWFFFFLFGLVRLALTLAGAEDDPSKAMALSRPVFDPAGIATAAVDRPGHDPEGGDDRLGRPRVLRPADDRARSVEGDPCHEGAGRAPFRQHAVRGDPAGFSRSSSSTDSIRGAARSRGEPGWWARRLARDSGAAREVRASPIGSPGAAVTLTPVSVHPPARSRSSPRPGSIWESASWIKWPLAVSAMLAGAASGQLRAGGVSRPARAVDLRGGRPREARRNERASCSPSPACRVRRSSGRRPRSASSCSRWERRLTIRSLLVSPARGLACLCGLAAIAADLRSAWARCSGGGKLFTALYLAVWYMGLSNLAAADVTSALSEHPEPIYAFIYMGAAAALLGAAWGRERVRATA